MSASLLARLRAEEHRQTRNDRLIASYFERNMADLPFETAKSIAERIGVSQMTIGRYLRRLGFDGLDGLKQHLRHGEHRTAWRVSSPFEQLQKDAQDGQLLARLVQDQIAELGRVYTMTTTPDWAAAVAALAGSAEVQVAAWQNVRGLAQYFASQLSYARPGVSFVDGLNGTYAEVLDPGGPGRCLLLVDVRRFASKARPLGEAARRAGITVVTLTDPTCTWAAEVSDIALTLPESQGPLWDGAGSMIAVLDMLMSSVIVTLGDSVNARVDRLTALQDRFGDFES